MGSSLRKVLILVTEDQYFLSHRLHLAKSILNAGYEVVVACKDTGKVEELRRHGFYHHEISFERSRLNPFLEFFILLQITAVYLRLKPHVVHHVALKPIFYGCLAARIARIPKVVNTFAGLGEVFTVDKPLYHWVRRVISLLFHLGQQPDRHSYVFQNPDDLKLFKKSTATKAQNFIIIPGSGVDVELFKPNEGRRAQPTLKVLLPARMLWTKGVGEFVGAATALKKKGYDAEFLLAGAVDTKNKSSIDETILRDWNNQGHIRYLGYQRDMADLLEQVDIVALPSYREGLPLSLLQAAACGKPIVTTDTPGCRDVVVHGETGLLVPAKDHESLAQALEKLLSNPEKLAEMGEKGRRYVEQRFSSAIINRQYLELYEGVGNH